MLSYRSLVAAGLLLIAAVPPLAWWWEASLVRHMLMQIPMLVLAGFLLGTLVAPSPDLGVREERAGGIAAVLLATFCVTFWMIPRWLDAAVASHRVDAIKIMTLVLLAGLPLAWGWPRLGPVARGFVWVQAISMAIVLGLLYLTFPNRLCNSYLVNEQAILGIAMLGIAGFLGLAGAVPVLFGANNGSPAPRHPGARVDP
ncbi:MAG: hypothetical protein IT338_19620 [Thermomicrobiales bacterium]|nr:hypothetical protein [Thermomicrobiales bacterium]